MSSANNSDALQAPQEPLPSRQMADRPVFHAEIGVELREIRQAKGWSITQAVLRARHKGHRKPTSQALRWLEEGRTRLPDADVLRAITDLYGLDYAALALRIASANYQRDLATYGSDLGRHAGDQGSVHHTHGGTADEFPASARRIAELETELKDLKARFGEVQDVARTLFRIAVGEESDAVARAQAKRGRPARKVG